MKRLLVALAAAVLLMVPAGANAVTDGQLDGERHPQVGLMVAQKAAGARCGGAAGR